MKRLLLLLSMCVALFSCQTQKVVTMQSTHDSTHVQIEARVDSVWRDRWHIEYTKGDTVFVHDSVFVDRFRWRERVDSVRVCDTIPVEVPVPTRMRNGYDRFTSWGFWILIVIMAGAITLRIMKRIYLHK